VRFLSRNFAFVLLLLGAFACDVGKVDTHGGRGEPSKARAGKTTSELSPSQAREAAQRLASKLQADLGNHAITLAVGLNADHRVDSCAVSSVGGSKELASQVDAAAAKELCALVKLWTFDPSAPTEVLIDFGPGHLQ
jgi:hypothetical protein